jgi:hypothetical protein
MRILRSWLDACGIKYEGRGHQIFVDGLRADIDGEIGNLNSTNLDISMGAFHRVTDSLGLGKPIPVDRGSKTSGKVYSDATLARLRHKEFRTAPDNDKFLDEQRNVISREVNIFLSKNRRLCNELGYESGDLLTHAMCWSITFAHRGRIMDCEGDDNSRLLTRYLRQRFTELYQSMVREKRGCMPKSCDIEADEFYDPFGEREEVDERVNVADRRRSSSQLLASGLAKMDHDTLVSSLHEAAEGPMYSARRAARKYLAEHTASCTACLHEAGKLKARE